MNHDSVRIDIIDEASAESFPASDPPSFTGMHAGAPAHDELEAEPPPDPERWLRRIAFAQGALYFASGLWPIVHLRSFEAVTGKKREKWLVQANGAILACVGLSLLRSAGKEPARQLGLTSAAAIAAVESVYALRGKIGRPYVADAAVELAIAAGWLLIRDRADRDDAA